MQKVGKCMLQTETQEYQKRIWTIPNVLSMVRLLLIPLIVWLYVGRQDYLWACAIYLASTGAVSFFVGRVLPKSWFQADRFPWKSYGFEKCGEFYRKLNIHKWQKKLPDMSRIFPQLMPVKALKVDYKDRLPEMIQETCVAEAVHAGLCITGLYALKICPGTGGKVMYGIYVLLFNLPFILIQRYNRPRLIRLDAKLQRSAKKCEP